MITLYDFELSADCYKLRLMLSILGRRYDVVPVDIFPGHDHDAEWFRLVSPQGRVPALVDDDHDGLHDHVSVALVHLAMHYDPTACWWDLYNLELTSEIEEWTHLAEMLSRSAGAARLAVNFGADVNLADAQQEAHRLLRIVDEHLWFGEREGRDWLCSATHPTIADIACFPDIALCEEGGISRQDYPAVRRWLDRVKRIPGFTTMSGVFPTAPAL